jgi:hypothetical protein
MRSCRLCLLWTSVLMGTTLLLRGCIYNYDAAVERLSPAEQTEFSIYRYIMTGAQTRTYLTKATAAERTAYLSQIGLVQRFQRLDPTDRDTVLSGSPRVGMSAEALLFVWGEPVDWAGDAQRSSRWHYMGSSLWRTPNYHPWEASNRVEVYLVNGKVMGWVDTLPYTHGGDCSRSGC